jgi:CubicO group peptidase (beta-lactamase class C family)
MNFEKLHDFLSKTIPCEKVPGCDILVYHKGQLVYREQFGTGDYPRLKPMESDAYHIMYSCSKVITCAAVLHLVEEGKLGLDDPVSNYLPAYADLTLADGSKAKNTMTVRHLFTMSSGLTYGIKSRYIQEKLRENPDADTVEIANTFIQWPLSFEPGTHYQYSLSHDVLAAIAEVITGQTFEQYVREWSGMEIDYNFNEHNRRHLSAQFMLLGDGKTLEPLGAENPYIFSKNYYSGGAGLIIRAADYGELLSRLSQGKLIKKETLDLMRTNQLDETRLADLHKTEWLPPYGYGLGVRTLLYPEKIGHTAPKGEFGWDGAAGSYAMVDSDREIAVAYIQGVRNCRWAYNEIHPRIRDLVYECLGYSFT